MSYKKELKTVQHYIISAIICDRCKKEYSFHECDVDEFITINHVCGYDSIFGDGNTINCDLCQNCIKELLGDYLNVTESQY